MKIALQQVKKNLRIPLRINRRIVWIVLALVLATMLLVSFSAKSYAATRNVAKDLYEVQNDDGEISNALNWIIRMKSGTATGLGGGSTAWMAWMINLLPMYVSKRETDAKIYNIDFSVYGTSQMMDDGFPLFIDPLVNLIDMNNMQSMQVSYNTINGEYWWYRNALILFDPSYVRE